jgi:hypothetical protein
MCGSAFFVANGFVSNTRLVRGESNRIFRGLSDAKERPVSMATIIIFLGVAAVVLTSVLPTRGDGGTFYPSLFSPLLGMIGCVLAAIVYPVLAVGIINKTEHELPEPQVLINEPIDGVRQDGINGWLMILFGGIFVLYYLASAQNLLLLLFISLFNIVITLGFILQFPLKMNKWHYKHLNLDRFDAERRNVKKRNISDELKASLLLNIEQQQKALKKHLERQAWLVFWTLFPWTILIFSFEYWKNLSPPTRSRNTKDRTIIRGWSEFLYQTYLFGCPHYCEKHTPE